ncbi:YARHG domain-containing protein [Aquimarina aquimarini]|uniref:YARHG domain-containing protein n=1 Tax=Aquimarina aquimarini TaxID=1191734 RepID=UPI000D54B0FC|nr:YARHG domain-containing protein [Aquimarina aquimarini]
MKIRLIVFYLYSGMCFCQISDTINKAYVAVQNYEINPSTIKKVVRPKISDYVGSYHFGESEGESDLEIIYSNDRLFARIEYSDWENDTWVAKSVRQSIEYSNGVVSIDKAFYELYKCTETSYLTLNQGVKGLGSSYVEEEEGKIYRYVQFNPNTSIIVPKGKYPEASFVKLSVDDLEQYTKSDLKIIRNEIYARNGYVFREGGTMNRYFLKQQWYKTVEKREEINLSEIEEYNVNLILKIE